MVLPHLQLPDLCLLHRDLHRPLIHFQAHIHSPALLPAEHPHHQELGGPRKLSQCLAIASTSLRRAVVYLFVALCLIPAPKNRMNMTRSTNLERVQMGNVAQFLIIHNSHVYVVVLPITFFVEWQPCNGLRWMEKVRCLSMRKGWDNVSTADDHRRVQKAESTGSTVGIQEPNAVEPLGCPPSLERNISPEPSNPKEIDPLCFRRS